MSDRLLDRNICQTPVNEAAEDDQKTQSHVYCVEDPQHTLIGKKAKPHSGTSPRNLTSTTIGDELVLAKGGKSRLFAVSIKDRGAIIPGGHLGKAFWYSKSTGEFVSSTYYFDDYPAWVKEWNKRRPADQYRDQTWTLSQPKSRYVYGNMDDRPFEKSYKYLGRTSPHALAEEIVKISGFSLAVTRTSLLAGKIIETPITRRIQLAFHPKRSGNVLIVQDQFWYLYHKPEAFAAMHGSPHAYDTFVPVMFSGPGVKPATVSRSIGPEDIAPTIAAYLGIKPPSGSVGAPLVEVLKDVKNQSVAKEP